MPVTSTTLGTGAVPVFQFSGVVTDAQIQTAWAATVVNGVYVLNRAIYLDNTADLTGVTGGFLVDFGTQVLPGLILHSSRDKTKSTFKNFTFLQRTGLIVNQRNSFVQLWNGTTLSNAGGGLTNDGLSQNGGGFVYGVPGNPGGADPRYLNEMPFGSLEGVTIYSQEFTEQELQIVVGASTQLKGLTFEKCYGFPQIGTPSASVNVVVYRSTQNTQSTANGGLIPIRLYPSAGRYAAACYVDSYITRNNADINTRLIDGFGSSATNPASFTVLNNYTRESWFGAAKTVMPITTWNAANTIYGGVLKKLQFVNGNGGVVRCYDSRSTTAAQKCKFSETGFIDFVDTSLAPTTDATGKISLVHIGAIATGATAAIARYTGQKYTFQKFGYRVLVGTPDMTSGDNDLSAFSPVSLTTQTGVIRTQAAITSATTITNFQDLLEELHVLAIGLSGEASYNGYADGNLFNFAGGVLTTNFASVTVNATAASKISYNSTTNALTIKSSVLAATGTVVSWSNASGTVTLSNGAKITGVYTSSAGTSTNLELRNVKDGAAYIAALNSDKTTILFGTNATGTAQTYTVNFAPGSVGTDIYVARQGYGDQFEFEVITLVAGAMFYSFTDIPDEGISEASLATVNGYTTIETTNKLYDRVAAFRMTEPGIKLGNIVVRAGTQLQFGSYSGVVNQSAAAVFNIVGSTITLKANALAGTTKYDTIIATPPATWTPNTTEELNVEIEDANGDSSVNIQASGISTFEIWKITDATDPDDYDTGVLLDTVPIGKFRFIGVNGYKMVIRDTTTNFRVVSEMEKGTYEAALFFGAAVQLAQAAEVSEINNKVDSMQLDITNLPANVWAFIVETGHSALATMRLMASVLVGKVSGAGTGTETFRDLGDTKDRVISSVDENGNRTNVTKDGT